MKPAMAAATEPPWLGSLLKHGTTTPKCEAQSPEMDPGDLNGVLSYN